VAFADVNGDGKIDVLSLADISSFDVYTAYYTQTAAYLWRLNNGDPNINHWPTTQNFLALRVTDPAAAAAPFLDLNNDGSRTRSWHSAAGQQSRSVRHEERRTAGVARPGNGTYALKTPAVSRAPPSRSRASRMSTAMVVSISGRTSPDTVIIRTGTSRTRPGDVQCHVHGDAAHGIALLPGFKHYSMDIDNSGLLSQAVIIHDGYGSNDGRPGGVSLYRKRPNGTYAAITRSQSGINFDEFYADNLAPVTGTTTAGSTSAEAVIRHPRHRQRLRAVDVDPVHHEQLDQGHAAVVTGFFAGAATIAVYDSGFAGDATHLVTPPKVLYTAGLGEPGLPLRHRHPQLGRCPRHVPGRPQVTRTGVAPTSRLTIRPRSARWLLDVAALSPWRLSSSRR